MDDRRLLISGHRIRLTDGLANVWEALTMGLSLFSGRIRTSSRKARRGCRFDQGTCHTRVVMMPSSPSDSRNPWGDTDTPYEEMGGVEGVRQLAETFYDVIEEESPLLREMLPANTKNTRQKFFMYLSGWLGGPPLYEEKWGHPRLRMRHFAFPIDDAAAAEWMRCMREALDRLGVEGDLRDFLDSRLAPLAEHMKNR